MMLINYLLVTSLAIVKLLKDKFVDVVIADCNPDNVVFIVDIDEVFVAIFVVSVVTFVVKVFNCVCPELVKSRYEAFDNVFCFPDNVVFMVDIDDVFVETFVVKVFNCVWPELVKSRYEAFDNVFC